MLSIDGIWTCDHFGNVNLKDLQEISILGQVPVQVRTSYKCISSMDWVHHDSIFSSLKCMLIYGSIYQTDSAHSRNISTNLK